MRRRIAAAYWLSASLLLTACSGTSAGETSSSSSAPYSPGPVVASALAAEPTPEPFHAAGYPTTQDEDTAFVSEVAALDTVKSLLTGHLYTLPTDLAEKAHQLAALGRDVCSSYGGSNIDAVVATVASNGIDAIDATAFVVAAAGVYCPQKLVSLGAGQAMTGGVVIQPVIPQCPPEAPIVVTVSPMQLTGQSNAEIYGDLWDEELADILSDDGTYSGRWSYTLTNTSNYDVIVTLEDRVVSEKYTQDWAAAQGTTSSSTHAPFYVPAHQSITDAGTISGVYAWQSAEYRIASWLPVQCQVTIG
ncbi:DUF732 domain-containing protein [Modestobacter sp. VKM Ac-2985]|uniref:DUF732 domain-containing protein n=1 Tax=Modestobacter sp. VKM Ac-2985 TaxID=3004139 RepID=UPI0022AB9852|nr:DUF732 domain-containing protein [Modestobacter sp. VKM Ac-2985]MCZ2837086.1 DUF732 domain-containing protein [Modestobacter sp. VKM Ac-2985]